MASRIAIVPKGASGMTRRFGGVPSVGNSSGGDDSIGFEGA